MDSGQYQRRCLKALEYQNYSGQTQRKRGLHRHLNSFANSVRRIHRLPVLCLLAALVRSSLLLFEPIKDRLRLLREQIRRLFSFYYFQTDLKIDWE